MTGFEKSLAGCGMVLVFCLLVAPAALTPSPAAMADEQTAEPSGDAQGPQGEDAKEGEKDEEKKESEATNVTFFPGVKGISGKELERIIREREERRKDEERKQRRYADQRETSTGRPKEEGEKESPPTRPAGRPKPAETPAEVGATGLKTTGLSDEAKEYLKTLALRTERLEYVLETVGEIRVEAERDAAKIGNEALIRYILQYSTRRTNDTRAYEAVLQFPLRLYRAVFDQAVAALKFAQSKPDGLSADAAKIADDYTTRLKAVWRQCLLATAELYTQVRQLNTAETIYAALAKEFPKDAEIKKSHEAFVKVRDAAKPDVPPGTQTGGGGSGRVYDDGRTDDTGDGEPQTPEDRIKKRYVR